VDDFIPASSQDANESVGMLLYFSHFNVVLPIQPTHRKLLIKKMLTFLNSLIFTASAAILIPLLIHLINRQKKQKKPFSSLRFLKLIEKQRLNRISIYQYLLIILRTLIIAFLVMAFARPTLMTGTTLGSSMARSTAVLILDSGVNMRYYDNQGMRYDRASQKMKEILALFKPEDKVFVIQAHNPQPINSDSLQFENMPCGYTGSDWDNAFAEANKIFNTYPNINLELYVISDFLTPASTFKSLENKDPGYNLYTFPIGGRSFENMGIDTLRFVSDLTEPNKPVDLQVAIFNAGQEEAKPVEINLYINDKREAYHRAVVPAGERIYIPISFQPREYGFLEGYLEINDDPLIADNRYYFNLWIPEKLHILYVDDQPSVFISSAFQTIGSITNSDITIANYAQWEMDNFSKYQKIFLANFPPITGPIQTRIKEYLQNGGRIIMMPGYNSTPNDINLLFRSIGSGINVFSLNEVNSSDAYFRLRFPITDHPIFNNIFRGLQPEIDSPLFNRYFRIKTKSSMTSIMEFTSGEPFLLSEDIKNGRLYLFTSYIDESWTDLQFKGIFIPLLTRLLSTDNYGTEQDQNHIPVGAHIAYPLRQAVRMTNYFLNTPGNEKIQLLPEKVLNRMELSSAYQIEPGQYRILAGNETISVYSANIPQYYNSASGLDAGEIPGQVFPEEDDFNTLISGFRTGNELWKFLVIFVIILIFVEFLAIKKVER